MYQTIRIRKEAQRKSATEGARYQSPVRGPLREQLAAMRRITQTGEHPSFFPGRVAVSFGGCHSFFAATVDGVKYRLAVMTLSLLCGITACDSLRLRDK
jgi:hypothetical protein